MQYTCNISKIQNPGTPVLFVLLVLQKSPPGWSLPVLNRRIPTTGRE